MCRSTTSQALPDAARFRPAPRQMRRSALIESPTVGVVLLARSVGRTDSAKCSASECSIARAYHNGWGTYVDGLTCVASPPASPARLTRRPLHLVRRVRTTGDGTTTGRTVTGTPVTNWAIPLVGSTLSSAVWAVAPPTRRASNDGFKGAGPRRRRRQHHEAFCDDFQRVAAFDMGGFPPLIGRQATVNSARRPIW